MFDKSTINKKICTSKLLTNNIKTNHLVSYLRDIKIKAYKNINV